MSLLSTITSTMYVSSGIQLLNNIPWTFIFFLTQLFGIRFYSLHKKEECMLIQKKIGKWCSHMTDNGKGYGYSIGKWYILSISITNSDRDGNTYNIYLLATESSYNMLIKENEDNIELVQSDNINNNISKKEKSSLIIFERLGSFYNIWFKKRTIKTTELTCRPEQQIIIDEVLDHYKNTKHTVVFLYGNPGSGKSMIGILLANKCNGSYCNTLNPWSPGDTLSALYSEAEPTEDSPLIIAFEEIDTHLVKIHQGIPPHKNLPISVPDKCGWNNLMDSVQRGLYPHLIILLTSNKTPDFINELDTAYLRENRIDMLLKLNN